MGVNQVSKRLIHKFERNQTDRFHGKLKAIEVVIDFFIYIFSYWISMFIIFDGHSNCKVGDFFTTQITGRIQTAYLKCGLCAFWIGTGTFINHEDEMSLYDCASCYKAVSTRLQPKDG